MFTTLRARLIASYVLIIFVTLAFAAATLPVLLRGYQDQATWARLEDQLELSARAVAGLWRESLSAAELLAQLPEIAAGPGGRLLLLDASGEVLADTAGTLVGQQIPQVTRQRRPGRQYFFGEFRTPLGQRMLYVALPLTPRLAQRTLILAQVAPAGGLRALADLGRRLLVAGAVALALALLLALLLARSISRPLARITQATEEVARGNLDHRLAVEGPDEVRRLAERFNAMAQEVKRSRQAQRDFVANVSHDLKTPLTSIQGFAQALLDGTASGRAARREAAQVICDEAARMNRMVEQLLELARWDAGQITIAQESVDLPQLLRMCQERMGWQAQQKGVELTVEVRPLPPLRGDSDRLMQVLTNLLDNALTYTPAGGSVTLAAAEVKDQAEVEITVTDTGPGIPAEELARIFERFYRVDKARAGRGAGLGLAIVKEIVEAHGGRVWAESSVGLGTRFVVRLPAAQRV
ncbi:MAG: ATP-binding protein [Anaerolineae bacterium]|nr:ATP-binding protein [Anaerolineae bacterium]